MSGQTVTPTERDSQIALESSRQLASHISDSEKLQFQILEDGKPVGELNIPPVALRMLLEILTQMAAGNAVTMIPVHAEMTTQQAADILNVSRPYLIGLLEQGQIEYHRVGSHRRIRFEHLMSFREKYGTHRNAALDELAQQAQELNMGY